MNCRHFEIEDEPFIDSFGLSIYRRLKVFWEINERRGGWMRALARICHLWFALVAAPKEDVLLALSC